MARFDVATNAKRATQIPLSLFGAQTGLRRCRTMSSNVANEWYAGVPLQWPAKFFCLIEAAQRLPPPM